MCSLPACSCNLFLYENIFPHSLNSSILHIPRVYFKDHKFMYGFLIYTHKMKHLNHITSWCNKIVSMFSFFSWNSNCKLYICVCLCAYTPKSTELFMVAQEIDKNISVAPPGFSITFSLHPFCFIYLVTPPVHSSFHELHILFCF